MIVSLVVLDKERPGFPCDRKSKSTPRCSTSQLSHRTYKNTLIHTRTNGRTKYSIEEALRLKITFTITLLTNIQDGRHHVGVHVVKMADQPGASSVPSDAVNWRAWIIVTEGILIKHVEKTKIFRHSNLTINVFFYGSTFWTKPFPHSLPHIHILPASVTPAPRSPHQVFLYFSLFLPMSLTPENCSPMLIKCSMIVSCSCVGSFLYNSYTVN